MSETIEKLVKDAGSKYVLASAVAKRAKQIKEGAKVLIDDLGKKPEITAIEEIAESKVEVTFDPEGHIKKAEEKKRADAEAAEVAAATAAEETEAEA